jgi:hypothetical protein
MPEESGFPIKNLGVSSSCGSGRWPVLEPASISLHVNRIGSSAPPHWIQS